MTAVEYLKNNYKLFKSYFGAFLRWLILGIATGALCGLCGAAFSLTISSVTALREENGWLLFLLPIAGIISVAIFKLCRTEAVGTNQVFECVRSEKPIPLLLMPAIFLGSALTHLCGGSAGKEGAALQLGGGIASLFAKVFRLREDTRHIITTASMGALFSAVFGTPLGACVFALEVVRVGNFCSAAFFPAVISSVTAFLVSSRLGAEAEHFAFSNVPNLEITVLLKVAVIAIVGALVSLLFCSGMHLGDKLFKKYFKNPFIRIALGGIIIILLTLAVGSNDYNGGGLSVIHGIFKGERVFPAAFLLKIIFTVITVSAGFKGGEIVPTLFIGAALGSSLGLVLGLDTAFGAAVGMAALFCGVTNCPLATILISLELFGAKGIIFFALSAITSFLLSGMSGLYSSQKFAFSKLREEALS